MSRHAWLGVALVVPALAVAVPGAAGQTDRLDRFRDLAIRHLGAAQVAESEDVEHAYLEIWALLDEEIVESLASGGVFASLAFLQDRLDGFADAWGGAALRLTRVGVLTVGAFQLGDGAAGASVRVYGRAGDHATLLAALQRGGRPSVYGLPAPAGGGAQFLAAWEGAPTGRGTRALHVDLLRQRGQDVAVAWSTANLFPGGLVAREWGARGAEIRIRYELHYPGFIPGCAGQTEQEDLFRLSSDRMTFTRVARRQYNAWHLAFHQVVGRLFRALAASDAGGLASVVPDPRLRARLPSALAPDPACDAAEPEGAATPSAVSMAALTADGRPWTLTWARAGGQWRLTAAAPVLQ